MAAFYLDHNVALDLAGLLRAEGHQATTAREIGLEGAPDDEHLLRAAEERSTLVTHNAADFLLLHGAWLRWSSAWDVTVSHAGILIISQPPRVTAERAAQELGKLVAFSLPLPNELYQLRAALRWHRLDPAAGWVPL